MSWLDILPYQLHIDFRCYLSIFVSVLATIFLVMSLIWLYNFFLLMKQNIRLQQHHNNDLSENRTNGNRSTEELYCAQICHSTPLNTQNMRDQQPFLDHSFTLNEQEEERPMCIEVVCNVQTPNDIQRSDTSIESVGYSDSYEFRTTRTGKIYNTYPVPVLVKRSSNSF